MIDLLLGLCILVANVAMRGLTYLLLWSWFIVPYTGFKDLTITAAIGLSMFVTIATTKTADIYMYDNIPPKEAGNIILKKMLFCVFAIAIGWLLK